jgi:protein-tyrosine phosphatase
LLLLGVPLNAIDYDYRLTDEALVQDKESLEERLAEIRSIGLTDNWGLTAEDMIERTMAHLESRYGGIDNYLDGIGFDRHCRETMRELLTY